MNKYSPQKLKLPNFFSSLKHIVQKRVTIADQRLLSLKCPVRKVSPWLASGILDLGNVPTNLTDRSGSLCLSYENNRVSAILEHAKQRVPT